jgi:hypothetical protein
MADLELTFINNDNNAEMDVELNDSLMVEQIIQGLIVEGFVPPLNDLTHSYALTIKGRTTLTKGQTLAGAGVQTHDRIFISMTPPAPSPLPPLIVSLPDKTTLPSFNNTLASPSTYQAKTRSTFRHRGVMVLSLIGLAVVGLVAITWLLLSQRNADTSTVPTPAPTPTTAPTSSAAPSGSPIIPTAAAIITNVQTSTDIDSNVLPTQVTSTFTLNQVVYVTFNFIFNGQPGWIEAKFYADGQLIPSFTNKLSINDGIHKNGALWPIGYQTYSAPTQGTAELYWCTQIDCSDEQLGAFINFTVTNTANIHKTSQPIVTILEGISPVNTTFSSASLSGTDIALPNSKKLG